MRQMVKGPVNSVRVLSVRLRTLLPQNSAQLSRTLWMKALHQLLKSLALDLTQTILSNSEKKKVLPGAFDDQAVYEDDEAMEEAYDQHNEESFLDERSVGSQSEHGVEEPIDQDDVFQDNESVSIVDQEMAGSFPQAGNTAEHYDEYSPDDEETDVMEETPGAILRARLRTMKNTGTPLKRKFTADNDWTTTLKTTISPQKQDRALLKSLIDLQGNDSQYGAEPTPTARRTVSDGRGFATSIDLMNSLFGQTRSPAKPAKISRKPKGFEVCLPFFLHLTTLMWVKILGCR